MKETDLYWLAGLLEGEGSFSIRGKKRSASIKVSMTDREPIAKAAQLMNCPVHHYPPNLRYPKDQYVASLNRAPEVRDLCQLLRPLMSPRRRQQIDTVIYRCNLIEDDHISGFQKASLVIYLINERGMSVMDLSRRTGIGHTVISRVLSGTKQRIGQRGKMWAIKNA